VKIAGRAVPRALLPPATAILLCGDQPLALSGLARGEEITVGRAGPLDEADPRGGRQKTLAAFAAAVLSGLMRK
jgi:hypothetical protein